MPLCLCDPRKRTSHANSHLSALPGQKKYFQVRSRRTQQLHRKLFVKKKKGNKSRTSHGHSTLVYPYCWSAFSRYLICFLVSSPIKRPDGKKAQRNGRLLLFLPGQNYLVEKGATFFERSRVFTTTSSLVEKDMKVTKKNQLYLSIVPTGNYFLNSSLYVLLTAIVMILIMAL